MTTRVIKFEPGLIPVLKFNPNHDNLGRFSSAGVSSGLAMQARQFANFEDFSHALSQQGLRPHSWHITENPTFQPDPNVKPLDRLGQNGDPALFLGDPGYWQEYAQGRNTVVEYDMTGLRWTKNPLSDAGADFYTDQSGNPGFVVRPSAYGKLREVGRMTVDEAIKRADAQQGSFPNSKEEARKIWDSVQSPVLKYNENHDELGRFASAGTGGAGGNGLNHKEIYQLQIGRADELKRAVYRAEEKYQPTETSTLPRPPYPLRDSYTTREEYEKAYKEYSKKFDEYARQSQQNIQSDLGKEYLDGTASGIRRYIGEIAHADWFKQSFGNGGVIGTPQVALSSVKAAGSYRVGLLKGSPFSKMYIDKGLSMNEPVILHEFAHYATAISVTAKYDGHGMEFIGNHLSIVNNVMGSAYASGLAKAYAKEGIPLGN